MSRWKKEKVEADLIALEVDHKGEVWWARHHDIHDEDPCILSTLASLKNSVVRMQSNVASGVRDFKEIDTEQLKHWLCGGRFDAILEICQATQLES
jgi:hypothetical protein